MSRNRKIPNHIFKRKTYAIVGDGNCEKWYFQMMSQSEKDKLTIQIKPELLKKAGLLKQFEYVKDLSENHDVVYWIVDYDVIQRESLECKKGEVKRSEEFKKYYQEITKKFPTVKILIVNPCFEYWVLLHFNFSYKKFTKCDETGVDLKKVLPTYEKTEKFYKKNGSDIYSFLKENLPNAIIRAKKLGGFDIHNPNNPVCEIYKIFDIEGILEIDISIKSV